MIVPMRAQRVSSLPEYKPSAKLAGVIRNWGSDQMGPLMKRWEEGFHRYQPGIYFSDNLKGTATAQFGLHEWVADIAVSTRKIYPYEFYGVYRRSLLYPVEIETLDRARIAHAGAGSSATEAAAPAVCLLPGKGRIMVYALGSTSSGIPSIWGAGDNQPGVNILTDLSDNTADCITAEIGKTKQPGDIVVVSIHWGANWGFEIPSEQISFAHRLIEGGVDLVHGHSSHHVKAVELYRKKLVLYGCGDFLTDYEGISGYEQFRGDLGLMYLAQIEPSQGQLLALRIVPVQSRRFRLERASPTDAQWLCRVFNDLGKPFGTEIRIEKDHSLVLETE